MAPKTLKPVLWFFGLCFAVTFGIVVGTMAAWSIKPQQAQSQSRNTPPASELAITNLLLHYFPDKPDEFRQIWREKLQGMTMVEAVEMMELRKTIESEKDPELIQD